MADVSCQLIVISYFDRECPAAWLTPTIRLRWDRYWDREEEALPTPNPETQCRENASQLHLFPLFATQKIGIIPKPGRMRPSLVHNNQHHKVGDIGEDMKCDAVFQRASKNIFLCCPSTCDKGQMFLFPCFVLVFLLPNVQPCSPLLCTLQSPATLPGPQGQPIRVQVGFGSANCGIARVSWVSSVLVDNQR